MINNYEIMNMHVLIIIISPKVMTALSKTLEKINKITAEKKSLASSQLSSCGSGGGSDRDQTDTIRQL